MKITKIHYHVFESSHNSQNKNNHFNGFCDEKRGGQGREGTGDNSCFIDQKLIKKESL